MSQAVIADVKCVAMLLCENVLVEKDDVLSVIRVVDIYTISQPLPDNPDVMFELPGLKLVAVMITGPGLPSDCLLTCDLPNGSNEVTGYVKTAPLEDRTARTNLVSSVDLPWGGEGVYTFKLEQNGVVIGSTPLTIRYNPEGRS